MREKKSSSGENEGEVSVREFEAMVKIAVKSLPLEFKCRLENINIVIGAEPSAAQRKAAGAGKNGELLGLYQGVPFGKRTHHNNNIFPDKITIFRGPVMRSCRNRREMRAAVRDTVLHEFAHYFGISDEHMKETGTY